MVSVWGKLGGAGLGYAVGGPLGALLGAFAGHVLVDREGAWFGPAPQDVIFTTGLVALSAKMAKADGVVLRTEVDAFERIVEVPPERARNVVRLFDLAKATTDGFEAYAGQIGDAFADEPALLEDVARRPVRHRQVADGAVHEAEFAYVQPRRRDLRRSRTGLRPHRRPPRQASGRSLSRCSAPTGACSDVALRRHYCGSSQENHPDREIARGLPPEAVKIATERLAAINAAWDRIATSGAHEP